MAERAVVRKELHPELSGLLPVATYSFDQLFRFAQIAYASGMFADVKDAAQAFMKIARGQELGLQPMAAMTAFDVIKDRLFIKPWAIAAKINSCGYGSYHVQTQTNDTCTIVFRRYQAGVGWRECPPVTYTIAEAEAHGLVSRSPHWKSSPAHMLYQRCMGRGGAMYFPELLAGLMPPPDTREVSVEQRQKHVNDLFDNDTDVEARKTARESQETGEREKIEPEGNQGHASPLFDPLESAALDAELLDAETGELV